MTDSTGTDTAPNMTPLMVADDIAHAFNATHDKDYWRATVGGSRAMPTVNFNSRSSMVTLSYNPANRTYTITFQRTQCAFGDFMASAHRSLQQVMVALKAAGLPVVAPISEDEGLLRVQYDPTTKQALVSIAGMRDDWPEVPAASFKDIKNILPELAAGVDTPAEPSN